MDRSNSVSSTSSNASSRTAHGTEPFAYQTRILERTASRSSSNAATLGRNNSVSSVLSANNTGGRRWTPSHRVGNASVDSVRGKWEERVRAEASAYATMEKEREIGSASAQTTAPNSPVGKDLLASSSSSSSSPTRSRAHMMTSSVGNLPSELASTSSFSSVPPSSIRRQSTMPPPIVANPLSPNNTGISVVSPDALSFMSAPTSTPTPTNRIHFPVSRPSVSSMRQRFNSMDATSTATATSATYAMPAAPATATGVEGLLSSEMTGTSSRARRSVDFDSIMRESRSSSSTVNSAVGDETLTATPKVTEDPSPRRLRPTSLYGTPHFSQSYSTSTDNILKTSSSRDRYDRPSSPEKLARSTSPVKISRHNSFEASKKAILQASSSQDVFSSTTSSTTERSSWSKTVSIPRRNSVKDSPFHRSSTPPVEQSPTKSNAASTITTYRPPPSAPSSYANVTSSVMSPTPYRSSYMANKKAEKYGDGLSLGRRLGRHLPRIASGDAYEDEPLPQEEKKRPPPVPEKENLAPTQDKLEIPDPRLSRLERREKRLRAWQMELDNKPSTPARRNAYPDSSPERERGMLTAPVTPRSPLTPHTPRTPGSARAGEDVAGVPGRKRLSRDVLAPVAPLGSPMPMPSARLGMRYGLWADTQRHLLRAYEYLCHVGEAQQWIEGCLGEELGFGVVEMEEGLRNGVVLAKLARVYLGSNVVRKIFEEPKLIYRQTDNINYFFLFIRHVGLPECFIFETTDLYNKKNIPKVIYCIHALSHLLARRGMAERIGNLLGQLKFSDDQLQKTEKGLKDAGVPMPNFGNIGRELAKEINEEPEVEIETEEERRDRMLLEEEDHIIALQATLRGFLVRKEQATHRARLELAQRYIVRFQARCRGRLTRQHVTEQRKQQASLTPWVIALQARIRGMIQRRRWKQRLARIHALRRTFVKVQAQARGVLQRRRYAALKTALMKSKVTILRLQAAARGKLVKRSHQQLHKTLEQPKTMQGVVGLQAAIRGLLVRKRISKLKRTLKNTEASVTRLQAQMRGALVRRRVGAQLAKLDDVSDVVVRIQAAARCYLARKRLLNLIRGLRRSTPAIITVQAAARAMLQRRQHKALHKALAEVKVVTAVGSLQALARAALVRRKNQEQTKKLEFVQPDVVGLQATIRGTLVRNLFRAWRDHIHANEDTATTLQAMIRGLLVRRRFVEKMRYYRENMDKVVKIQSLYRAKETREQYRQLTLGRNVNVSTIKNFVHLLDDSEADFEDEIELERLRKRVVQSIRANQALETEVNELDVKIALVVQNVKSFEELVKARRRNDSVAAHAARASVLAAHGDPFAGHSSLDQDTKRKLELYQQLFYLLQARGEYLSKLFHQLAKSEITEKNRKLVERVVLTLFGYGHDRREEYLLLKLFQACTKNEIAIAPSVEEALKEVPLYLSIALQYGRTKQVTYVRDVLQPLVWTVIDGVVNDEKLDLETDPCVIYRARINVEEMRTGMISNKPKDVDYRVAVQDHETRLIFIQNLQKLHALTKDFVNAICSSTKKLPYGMRFLARETLAALKAKHPNQTDEEYAIPLTRLLFYRYINPAIVAPETFDIVPNTIDISSRKNLAQISKMLTQIASGKIFGEANPCLSPLDKYVAEAIKQMRAWVLEVADVQNAEAQYHANEFLDVTVQPKPIYISPNEVYSMHSLLSQHLERLASSRDDPLRAIIVELGGVPHLGNEELNAARDLAITLELTNRFANVKDPHAEEKALWVQAKRAVLAILRVQPARDLVECLMSPVSEEHEMFWEDIVDRELMNDNLRQRRRRMPSTTGAESAYRLDDIRSLTFKEVKAHAIYFLLELEKQRKVTREDGYQGILNAIAGDVRSKHRKRLQRQQELASMNEALQHLTERKKYYEEQIKSYNNYVEGAMNTMQKGKSKKRFVMPFTKQYFHLRDLQKSGRSPQFGSFKYSAASLYEKGILLSIDQYSPRQFDRIDLVLSSDKAGHFEVELYNTTLGQSLPIASTEIRMEDLLQAQFENRVSFPLFDGMAKFNLNLFLYQINKKFYV